MGNEDRTIDRCQIPFELQGNVPHFFRFETVATPQAMANSTDRLTGCFHSLEVIVEADWRSQPEQGKKIYCLAQADPKSFAELG